MSHVFIPYEVPAHDGFDDISDVWMEEQDPDNERGEICEAFFADNISDSGCRCELIAIRILGIEGNRELTLPRDFALKLLTPMTVTRIERRRARLLDEAT